MKSVSFPVFLCLCLFALPPAGAEQEDIRWFDSVLEPKEALDLVLDVSGIVESVAVSEASEVAAGTELLRLRARPQELRLREVEARLEHARARLAALERKEARYDELREDGLVSEDQWMDLSLQLIDARAAVAAAGSERAMAGEELNRRILRAPAPGVVFRLSRRPGEGVQPQEVLVELLNVESLRANFFLPVGFVGHFRTGEELMLFPADSSADADGVPARVDRVDPFIDPATGVMRLSVVLLAREDFFPGKNVRIRVATPPAAGQ